MESAKSFFTAVVIALAAFATPASALDGCKVLLCLAGPWQSIPACTSEVETLFRSLRNGDPFPTCSLASGGVYAPSMHGFESGGSVSAANILLGQWMLEPDPKCPPQFVTAFEVKGAARYGCQYAGVVAVYVDVQPWSRTYWNMGGASFTEISGFGGTEAAK